MAPVLIVLHQRMRLLLLPSGNDFLNGSVTEVKLNQVGAIPLKFLTPLQRHVPQLGTKFVAILLSQGSGHLHCKSLSFLFFDKSERSVLPLLLLLLLLRGCCGRHRRGKG